MLPQYCILTQIKQSYNTYITRYGNKKQRSYIGLENN